MTTIQIPNEILRKLPGPALRLVLQLNLAREPLTGDVLATLCDKSKNWASMTVPSAREALEPLGYSIKNDGNGYYIVKHEVVAAPPVVRKSSSATLTVPSSHASAADAPSPTIVASEPKAPTEKVPHRVTIFRFPWGGFVDMHSVVGATVERGSLVLQLQDGGYIRSPPHSQAEQVCAAITDTKAQMPNVISRSLST